MNSRKTAHHFALFSAFASLCIWVLKNIKINLERKTDFPLFSSLTIYDILKETKGLLLKVVCIIMTTHYLVIENTTT